MWMIQVAFPGAYRSVCVKLEVQHLAVTAVEQASLLEELEESSAAESSHFPAFQILKNLVHKWLTDATTYQNK